MILGIDASNLGTGGGATHLVEFLAAAQPARHGFEQIIVWSRTSTLGRVRDEPWLVKLHDCRLERKLPARLFWQSACLARQARHMNCAILYVPGGSYLGGFHPFVAMSQNMLPFENAEIWRYKDSLLMLKQVALRMAAARTFRRADGVIFLADHAQRTISRIAGSRDTVHELIPHGVSDRFRLLPRPQAPLGNYSATCPLRLLYVSHFVRYKHQWEVARAVGVLRRQGLPICIEFVGSLGNYFRRFEAVLRSIPDAGAFITCTGPLSYTDLHAKYHNADVFVFASSCENLPITLLEAMASGLPIACSDIEPNRELLGDAGEYFDPTSYCSIAAALRRLLSDPEKRAVRAWDAYRRAQAFTWERCAHSTLSFLSEIAIEF